MRLLVFLMLALASFAGASGTPTPNPPTPNPPTQNTQTKCVTVNGQPVCGEFATPPANTSATLPDPIAATVNFDQWMRVFGDVFDSVDAKVFFRQIGAAILGMGAFFLAIQLVLRGGLFDGFQYVFLRSLIAAVVFLAADPIGDLWKFTWHTGYKYSTGAMLNIYVESAQQMAKLSQDMPLAIIKVKTITATETGQTSASVQVQQKEGQNNWLEGLWLGLIAPLSGLIYVCLSGFYTFAVLAGVLTIQFGKIIFPLVAAMLIFPGGSGLQAFSVWAKAMTSSVLAAFFLPLIYAIAAFIAVLIPMSHAKAFITYVDSVVNAMKSMSQSVQGTGFVPEALANMVSGLTNLWGVGDIMGAIVKFTGVMVILPVAMLLGLVIAANIIMKASSMIAGLIGGVAIGGGYENPVARAASSLWGTPALGAVGGAVGAAGAAVAGGAVSGAKAVGGAALGAAGAAAGGVASAARSAGVSAVLTYGAVRPAPALGSSPPSISKVVANGPTRQGPPALDGAAVAQRANLMQSRNGQFVNDNYGAPQAPRGRVRGAK